MEKYQISRNMVSKEKKVNNPLSVHVMAKPSGAICNILCEYCFYLEKEKVNNNLKYIEIKEKIKKLTKEEF